ncbi:unnamed protein product [Blepharisma stoltei]|uniref:PPM-type phosphatase domain-containing protein n=1 Tax=Blepharisma stoltei TaxID=1481888 RepID=A0AAU9JYB0_9CILI|nr:unnamed protein product [Blepharisma stoltei]
MSISNPNSRLSERLPETPPHLQWKSSVPSLLPLSVDYLSTPRISSAHTSRSTKSLKNSTQNLTARSSEPDGRALTTRSTDRRFFGNSETPSDQTKCSLKESGSVKAYAASTNQGLIRNYNEDRVSIILNIMKPPNRSGEPWPRCSFFGVYDGHGGAACADFLRDNLHQYVIRNHYFPHNPKEAIRNGFEAAERAFLELAERNQPVERSGSCANVVLIVGDNCYVANVGDSRAVMSGDGGTKIYPLSKDHKPCEEKERQRIINNGGKVYQSTAQVQGSQIAGPYRIFPGRLSVSRTIGDIEAKMPSYNGNPNVLISTPEIKAFRIHQDFDFIILATDGIFDKMTNKEVIKSAWSCIYDSKTRNAHQLCGIAVENVMSTALNKKTTDNVTVVMVGLEGFINKIEELYGKECLS